ncbi:MAG: hypothetical protein V1847_00325 [Candidatus Diapherotrites archaeon]
MANARNSVDRLNPIKALVKSLEKGVLVKDSQPAFSKQAGRLHL